MSKLNGNGSGRDNENVSSLEDARRRAAAKAKAASRAGKPSWTGPESGPQGPRTTRDWVIGGIIIAMAVAFVGSLVMRATQSVGGGV